MITLLYYTNNLLPEKLLEKTLFNAAFFAEKNNFELIICSQFPLTKNFKKIKNGDHLFVSNKKIYKHILKKEYDLNCDYKEVVLGKLPYNLNSIYTQIIKGLSFSKFNKISLLEHDCLYPLNYFNTVNNSLNLYDFCFIENSRTFLNFNGFWIPQSAYFLSGCNMVKNIGFEIFFSKIELFKKNKLCYFEPVLSNLIKNENCEDDFVVKNYENIDKYFSNSSVLDIKHGLNQNGYLNSLSYSDFDFYWGHKNEYIDLLNKDIENTYAYGLIE